MATKVPLANVTEYQLSALGSVRPVQVMPSDEVAALVLPVATATKTPFPYVMARQLAELGKVRAVHVEPSLAE